MRRAASVLGLALVGTAPAAHAQVAGAEVYHALRTQPRVRVVVSLREPTGASLALRAGEIERTRRAVLSGIHPLDFQLTHAWPSISAVAGLVSARGLQALLADPDVLRVDLDVPMFAAASESVALIRAKEAHDRGVTGRGVTVAVLDTGVDGGHPDLKDSLAAEECFCANRDGTGCCPGGTTRASGPAAARDDNGHGTNVAGVITASGRVAPLGVAPDAMIVAVKVLDKDGVASSTTQVLSGLDYVLTQRPDVRVVNVSIATANLFPGTCDNAASFTQAFASAVSALRGRGVLVVASAGNDGNAGQIAVPACVGAVVAVGAVYDDNVGMISFGCTDPTTAADRVTCFTNSSGAVDLLAPGAVITSAGVGGGTSNYLGTSQAAPHAAGAAALLLSAKPGLGPDQVELALKSTGASVVDSRNGLALRRIDVQAALAAP